MKLECEFATKSWELTKPWTSFTEGTYKLGHPTGAVIHYTAGAARPTSHIETGRSELTKKHGDKYDTAYTYWLIGVTGEILQTALVSRWGYHAGRAHWTNPTTAATTKSINKEFIGIEIVNPGHLTKDENGENYRSWFGQPYTPEQVRLFKEKTGNIYPGAYVPYTGEQERSLIKLLLWLKGNAPDIFDLDNVVGHDEVAYPRGRKQDPGGALSMTMREFRLLLKNKYEQGLVNS